MWGRSLRGRRGPAPAGVRRRAFPPAMRALPSLPPRPRAAGRGPQPRATPRRYAGPPSRGARGVGGRACGARRAVPVNENPGGWRVKGVSLCFQQCRRGEPGGSGGPERSAAAPRLSRRREGERRAGQREEEEKKSHIIEEEETPHPTPPSESFSPLRALKRSEKEKVGGGVVGSFFYSFLYFLNPSISTPRRNTFTPNPPSLSTIISKFLTNFGGFVTMYLSPPFRPPTPPPNPLSLSQRPVL